MKNIIKKNFLFSLIFIIPTVLTLIWFKNGNILGHGESGLPFYNLELQLAAFRDSWANYTLGIPTNITTASIPTYRLLSIIQKAGVPGYLIQAIYFWLIFVVSGLSVYSLTKLLFPKLENKLYLMSVFFYWFNPFSLVNVWNRFLNNFILFYALLPLLLFLFIKGIKTSKYIYAIMIPLTTVIFSYALTSIVASVLVWVILFYTACFYIFVGKSRKDRLFIVKYFFICLILFVAVNIWWISQTITYAFSGSFAPAAASFFRSSGNYDSLSVVSHQLGNIGDLIRLRHGPIYSKDGLFWLQIYNIVPIVLLEFGIFAIILFAFIKNRRNSDVLYITSFLILSIFFSKGINPPMGEIFDFIFVKFTFLQIFRNPFEKILFLAPLAEAPMFALGIFSLFEIISNRGRKILYLASFIWLVIIWGYPFWTRLVFANSDYLNETNINFEVKVPKDYENAVEWLNSKEGRFRLIVLPLGNEGITYLWERGYSGIELSNQIFPVPAVSLNTTIPYYNTVVKSLENDILKSGDVTDLMNNLNARYILLRKDIDWRNRRMRDPSIILNTLQEKEKRGEIFKVAEFGDLSFWENKHWNDNTFYTKYDVVFTYPAISSVADLEDFKSLLGRNNIFIPESENYGIKNLGIGSEVYPSAKFTLKYKEKPTFEIRQDIFPSVKYLPTSKIYKVVLFKSNLESMLIKDKRSLAFNEISMLGKRIVEAKVETDRKNDKAVLFVLGEYQKQLKDFFKIFNEVNIEFSTNNQSFAQEDIYNIFSKHKAVLTDIKNVFMGNGEVTSFIDVTINQIDQLSLNLNIVPAYGFIEKERYQINNRIVYKFIVPESGKYELIWGNNPMNKYYESKNNKTLMQIDSDLLDSELKETDRGMISFGQIYFDAGVHDIGLNSPESVNLVDTPKELDLKVDHDDDIRSFTIKNFDPGATYTLSFDYLIKKGSGLNVSLITNNDGYFEKKSNSNKSILPVSLKNSFNFIIGKKISLDLIPNPTFNRFFSPDLYEFSEKSYTTTITVPASADGGSLVFKINPWNNCNDIFRTKGMEKCDDANFRRQYDKTTEVLIKNILLTRVFNEEPLLIRKDVDEISGDSLPTSNLYKKINNSDYVLSIHGSTEPFVLVFNDLFDNQWRLFKQKKEISKDSHFLVNNFANGWLIDGSGDFDLEVKFISQDLLSLGEKISIISFFLGLIMAVILYIRNRNENT